MSLATLAQPAPRLAGPEVSWSTEGGNTVVVLRGEMDTSTLPVLVDALARVIAERDGGVVVDLAQTEFIDIAALRALLRARNVLAGGERQLTFGTPSRVAGRLLAVFGLSHLVRPAA